MSKFSTRFDAIVIDCDLPDKEGFVLLSEVRGQYSDLPAVLTIKAGDERTISDQRAVRVEKPYTAAMIIAGLAAFEPTAD